MGIRRSVAIGVAVLMGACAPSSSTSDAPVTAFTGATVWDGTGTAAVANATLLVREGRVVSIEAGGAVPDDAEEVSLDGRFVVPGFVDAHAHVDGLWAPESISGELERVRATMTLFARYGVTTVNSLGDDASTIRARDEASPTDPRARIFAAGPVIAASDPADARRDALENVEAGVDWLKLRIDDNLGTSEKMPWSAVQAVVDVSDEHGVPLATHLFYLDDAKRLVEMGSDMVAHSVRDTAVDQEFIEQLRASGVCYVPTLTREVSTFVYADRPDFFDDPFFTRDAHPGQMERVSDPGFMEGMAGSTSAAAYRVALERAMENVKTLSDAGVSVAMGTDAGPAARFPGYFEHLELWMMVDAGLSPEEALRSATATAARCIGADEVGTLEAGKWADFLVLEENPLEDIRATGTLQTVYVGGRAID